MGTSQTERHQEAQPPTQRRETLGSNKPQPSLAQVSRLALLGSKDVGSGVLASRGCPGYRGLWREVWGEGPGVWKGVTRQMSPKDNNGIECQAGGSP